MHGDKSQRQRERALAQFESGRVDTLVATDVAARGIDVDDITHVINFDPPEDREAYVHRIGRTGRAGSTGVGITFVGSEHNSDMSKIARELELEREYAASGHSPSTSSTGGGNGGSGGSRGRRQDHAPARARHRPGRRSPGRRRLAQEELAASAPAAPPVPARATAAAAGGSARTVASARPSGRAPRPLGTAAWQATDRLADPRSVPGSRGLELDRSASGRGSGRGAGVEPAAERGGVERAGDVEALAGVAAE